MRQSSSSIHQSTAKRMIPCLGTFVRIELRSSEHGTLALHGLIDLMFDEFKAVDALMSYYSIDSQISKLNQAKVGEWVPVDPRCFEVLAFSEKLRVDSKGLFNVGFFDGWSGKFYDLREEDSSVRKLYPGELDLGGVAKGYAVDRAFSVVKNFNERGVLFGSINAGGDVFLFEASEIQLGIQTSVAGGTDHRIMSVQKGAIATSVSRCENDLRLSHRTVTGARVASSKTVSVFAKSAMHADALTKILLAAETDSEHARAKECISAYEANGFYEIHEGI